LDAFVCYGTLDWCFPLVFSRWAAETSISAN
jgi:hypothetical protein